MRSRQFLDLAKRLVVIPHEANWRCATGRAYYALLLECRDALERWGFVCPSQDAIHYFVRSRFSNTGNIETQRIGATLKDLSRLRNVSDYQMTAAQFANNQHAKRAVDRAEECLQLLDAIEANPVDRSAAITDIKSRWP